VHILVWELIIKLMNGMSNIKHNIVGYCEIVYSDNHSNIHVYNIYVLNTYNNFAVLSCLIVSTMRWPVAATARMRVHSSLRTTVRMECAV
jgi:hypothetical protein